MIRTGSVIVLWVGLFAVTGIAADGEVEFSTLVTAHDVTKHLSTEAGCRDAAKRFGALGIRRIWLESLRSGHRVDRDTLVQARDVLHDEGLIVSGALTVTWGEGFGVRDSGGYFLCYSAEETKKALAETATEACALFDEVMYDDFLATHCRCERCTREKGDRSWAVYRCELKSRVARDFIVRPGHEANPKCVIIIKYPQWYDKFHRLGYDVVRDTAYFDEIWVGTETRGPDTPRFGFVPTYQSTNAFRWLASLGEAGTRGGWFDPYDCTPDEYVDQGYATVLAGATELMRFNGFHILPDGQYGPLMTAFAPHRARIEALSRLLHGRSPLGLIAYKPPHSSSGDEDYWFDYFGNLGIPLRATARFPATKKPGTLVLTRAARHDPKIDQRVVDWAGRGGSLIASTGFVAGASPDVLDLFGLDRVEARPIDADALFIEQKLIESPKPMSLGGVLHPGRARVRVSGRVGSDRVPLLTVAPIAAGGHAAVVNLRTHDIDESLLMDKPVPWIDLPEPVTNLVREVALKATGLRIQAPPRVNVHGFSGNCVGLINPTEREVPIRLSLSPPWFSPSPTLLSVSHTEQRLKATGDGEFVWA